MAGRKRVLWVDDEIEFLRSHIMFLETRGYSVFPVFSGDDAIGLLQKDPRRFDIVLLDEQMPGKDGLTTLEEIKDMYPDLPVVMVTKSEEERVMEDALGKKIDGYLTKPVNPSQILLVCKNLLDSKQLISSQIAQRYIRSYSELRSKITGRLSAQEWIGINESLVKWDLELERVEDEGLRQTHAGQKSDCNRAFSNYVIESYAEWIKGKAAPPLLSTDVLKTFLAPLLKKREKVIFVVMSGMRLDQYLGIEAAVRKMYDVKRHYFFSTLPSSTTFSRPALLSGRFPGDIAHSYKGVWATGEEDEAAVSIHEPALLRDALKQYGIRQKNELLHVKLTDTLDAESALALIDSRPDARVVSIVVNFVELLIRDRSTSAILQEMAPDENAFRALTNAWFQHSSVLQILKELSQRDYTIIFTSDHGSVLCSRGTEIYGVEELGTSLRFKFGDNITSDERNVVNLSDPGHYNLPKFSETHNCIIAKENYYFIHPEKFEYYQKQYQNTFQEGGISLEEVIVPLGIFTPQV